MQEFKFFVNMHTSGFSGGSYFLRGAHIVKDIFPGLVVHFGFVSVYSVFRYRRCG